MAKATKDPEFVIGIPVTKKEIDRIVRGYCEPLEDFFDNKLNASVGFNMKAFRDEVRSNPNIINKIKQNVIKYVKNVLHDMQDPCSTDGLDVFVDYPIAAKLESVYNDRGLDENWRFQIAEAMNLLTKRGYKITKEI